MNKKEREEFRKGRAWKQFKQDCRLSCSTDFITKEPLVKTWNLHHLDLDVSRYDRLDKDKFVPLNPKTHELVHEVYKRWKKDKGIIRRLEIILEKMEEYTNVKE